MKQVTYTLEEIEAALHPEKISQSDLNKMKKNFSIRNGLAINQMIDAWQQLRYELGVSDICPIGL